MLAIATTCTCRLCMPLPSRRTCGGNVADIRGCRVCPGSSDWQGHGRHDSAGVAQPPDVHHDIVGRIARDERCKGKLHSQPSPNARSSASYLFLRCHNANRIGNDNGSHLLVNTLDVCKRNHELKGQLGLTEVQHTDIGDPAKEVGVETDMILRDVQSALDKDILCKGTAIVCRRQRAQRSRRSLHHQSGSRPHPQLQRAREIPDYVGCSRLQNP